MKIYKTLQKIPAGVMVIPLLLGATLNTFFPEFLNMGGFTSGVLKMATNSATGLFVLFSGACINFKQVGTPLKKGFWLTLIKFVIGAGIGVLIGKIFGPSGFLGLTPLALVAAITNSNGAVYSALAGEYGDATDVGAISILSLNDGPFLTMIALGATGLADIPLKALIAAILPLIIGFVLGNLDEDLRKVFSNALPAIIMFSGLALGAGMDLRQVVQAGPSGIFLGLLTLLSTGLLAFYIYSAILRKKNPCGAAIGTTAGNAVATPAAVATADPTLESIAGVATAQVAASTIITAILCPFLVAFLAKKVKAKEQAQE